MKYLATLILSLFSTFSLLAQAASDSPYSGQKFDPTAAAAWYESPLFVVISIAILGLLVLFVKKRA